MDLRILQRREVDMNYLILKIWTQTASFRVPEFQNFHKSFLLPPPTTVIGLAGAALGLSPKSSQDFFDGSSIKLGVFGKSDGYAIDLWKFKKKNNNKTNDQRDFIEDILRREIHFNNVYLILFASENSELIDKLRSAFENPKYALTFGTSDALAKISILDNFEEHELDEVENCLIEGDIISEVVENVHNGLEFSIYSTSEPIVYDLPVKFQYESDYGVRRVVERKKYSFVGKKMKLNIKISGVYADDKFIPIISI